MQPSHKQRLERERERERERAPHALALGLGLTEGLLLLAPLPLQLLVPSARGQYQTCCRARVADSVPAGSAYAPRATWQPATPHAPGTTVALRECEQGSGTSVVGETYTPW
eukprot:1747056-Rhodomonas_salina.2